MGPDLHRILERGRGAGRRRPLALVHLLLPPGLVVVAAALLASVDRLSPYAKAAGSSLIALGKLIVVFGAAPDATFGLSVAELVALVVFMDVVCAYFLAHNLHHVYRTRRLGPALRRLTDYCRYVLDTRPWMRRWAFAGVAAFVLFPLTGTGAPGGSVLGRLVGLHLLYNADDSIDGRLRRAAGTRLRDRAGRVVVPRERPGGHWYPAAVPVALGQPPGAEGAGARGGRRPGRAGMKAGALLLLGLAAAAPPLWGQTGAPPRDSRLWGEIEIGEPGTKLEDAGVARRKVAEFKAGLRKTKDKLERASLMRKLGDWDHPEILKAAAACVGKKNRFLAIEAAVVLARQSDRQKAGAKLVSSLKKEKRHDVICALLVACGTVQSTKAAKLAEPWLRYETDEPRNELQKAAIRYYGLVKAKGAFRSLATLLDDPQKRSPYGVDDPNNPPASVWEKRWKAWEANDPYVRRALQRITDGETFETTAEAKAWAQTPEAKKLGIKW
ncbi:MAG: small multi-drug export protein [Planctomycetota bacterium]